MQGGIEDHRQIGNQPLHDGDDCLHCGGDKLRKCRADTLHQRNDDLNGGIHQNSEKKQLLTEETVELLTSPGELAEYKDAITEAMMKGTKRNVESEDTSKNAVTAE